MTPFFGGIWIEGRGVVSPRLLLQHFLNCSISEISSCRSKCLPAHRMQNNKRTMTAPPTHLSE